MTPEREQEIRRTHRHAMATRPTETDSWLNGYRDDVAALLAEIDEVRKERDEAVQTVDDEGHLAQMFADRATAAEARVVTLETALRQIERAAGGFASMTACEALRPVPSTSEGEKE